MRMEIELIPQGGGDSGLASYKIIEVCGPGRVCAMFYFMSILYLLRMIPNLMLRFDFKCFEHRSTEKPKSCNGSAEKNTTDEV